MRIRTAVACVLFALTCGYASAADDSHRFEVTPVLGYRSGGDFDALTGPDNPNVRPGAAYGAIFGWLLGDGQRIELLYTFQPSEIEEIGVDLNVEHLHIGASATFNETESLLPFIAAGLGASRLAPDSGSSETRISGSLAIGVDAPLARNFALRIEARGYLVSMDGDATIFCSGEPGSCLVRAAGDTLFQYELLTGVTIRF